MRCLLNCGWMKHLEGQAEDWHFWCNRPWEDGKYDVCIDLSDPFLHMSANCPRDKRFYIHTEPSWYLHPHPKALGETYAHIRSHCPEHNVCEDFRLYDYVGAWATWPVPAEPLEFGISGIFSGKHDRDPKLFRGSGYKIRKELLWLNGRIKIPNIVFSPLGSWNGQSFIYPLETKGPALKHMFHLAIENCSEPNYHSEKIIDCFLMGVVPLYYGDPCIGDWFDPRGIIQLDLNDPLGQINSLTPEAYHCRADAIANNMSLAQRYVDRFAEVRDALLCP